MKTIRRPSNKLLIVSVLAIVVGLFAHLTGVSASNVSAPDRDIQTAWRNASLADSFAFNTDVTQTTYPALAISNVGQSSRTEAMHIEGNLDRPNQTMLMSLWNGGGTVLNTQDALELRVSGTKTEGRVSGGDWQPMDNAIDAFAPSGDPLSFLSATRNVAQIQAVLPSDLAPNNALSYAAYSFELDGPALAQYLRDQLEAQLAAQGQLPAGVTLDTPADFRGATGTGQIWLVNNGYPARLDISMALPEQQNGERVEVHLISHFTNFKSNFLTSTAPDSLAGQVQAALASLSRTFTASVTQALAFSLAFVACMLWAISKLRRSRPLYAAFSIVMILSMTVAPLLQSERVYAFAQQQNTQAADFKAMQQAQLETNQLNTEMYANTWDPQRDPLSAASTIGAGNLPIGSLASTSLSTARLMASSTVSSTTTANPGGDDDNDGLTNLQEVRLGTNLGSPDSDSDLIPDKAEVVGFTYNNKPWYLDPTVPDTNNDGLSDTEECPERVVGACRDTDGDLTPDAFDPDNDNDGVIDRLDLSPYKVMGRNGGLTNALPFSSTTPLQFKIDNLQRQGTNQPGYQTFVDFQVRPTDPKHLWYAFNVYDWPGGDTQGQVQRPLTDTNGITNTTFATYNGTGNPKDSNGDVRLVPMLEIIMSGNPLPVPLITPRAAQSFAGSGITGTLTLSPTGASTQFSFTFTGSGSYTTTLESGSCLASTTTQTQTMSNGGTFSVTNRSVLALANGQNLLRFTDVLSTARSICVPLVDVPNGAYTDKMLDTSFFAPYGVSVRDVNTTTVAAYVPLNLVSDPSTSERVAFAARMPYWPSDPTNWGNTHQVRMVWVVSVLTADGGTSMVQTYPDTWTLTGLNVREDRGVDLAIAFENPNTDNTANVDERLYYLAQGLEGSFLAGRDADNNNQRDVTVGEIKRRFDITSTVTITDRWGLPSGAFRVFTYNYAQSDEVAKVMMTDTTSLLNTYFTNATQPRSEALFLYARETRARQLSLDDAQSAPSIQNNVLTLNLDPARVQPQTMATLNAAPYRYTGGQWQNYPLNDYADKLTTNLKALFATEPADEQPADVELTKNAFLALTQGSTSPVALNDKPSPNANAAPDSKLSDDVKAVVQGTQSALKAKAGELADFMLKAAIPLLDENEAISLGGENRAWLSDLPFAGEVGRQLNAKKEISNALKNFGGQWAEAFHLNKLNRISGVKTFSYRRAGAVAIGAVGLTIFAAVQGAKQSGYGHTMHAVSSALAAVNLIMAAKDLSLAVNAYRAAKAAAANVTLLSELPFFEGASSTSAAVEEITAVSNSAKLVSKVVKNLPTIGLVLTIGLTWGLTIAQMAMDHVKFGSAQFMNMLAEAIATAIVAVLMFAIASIPIVGQLIAAIIGAIDAVIAVICSAALSKKQAESQVGKRVCKGISGLMGEFVKNFLYSRRSLVGNMSSPDRLDYLNMFDMFKLVDPSTGMVQGANTALSLELRNTIIRNRMIKSGQEIKDAILPFPFDPLALPYLWQYSNANLKTATFAYELQTEQRNIHKPLERDTMSGQWQPVSGTDNKFTYTTVVQTTTNQALNQAGINQPLNIVLAEGQAIPAQQCIGIPTPIPAAPVIPLCWIVADKTTSFIPLGQSLIYDVFPPTLDGFVAAIETKDKDGNNDGGYTLTWAQTGALKFGRQKDVDGDGLINKADGGNDPNDTLWDTDGDGLSDYAELKLGADPLKADTDNDSLLDAEEAAYGTNPRRADTDGDGLTDKEEVTGWEFVYANTPTGQLRTWVTSDPLSPDEDEDTLTDAQEKIFGFNPRVKSSLNILTYEAEVVEQKAPRVLWQFEQSVNATSFTDSSGYNAPGACADANTCPTSGVTGAYGNAVMFDGIDDVILTTASATLPSFTVAFWANPAALPDIQFALDAGNNNAEDVWWNGDQILCGHPTQNPSTTAYLTATGVRDGNWHHWACTFDAATNMRKLYRDGQLIGQGSIASPGLSGQWYIGKSQRALDSAGTKYFPLKGSLDELVVLNRALSATELQAVRDGSYNLNDLTVKPGDVLSYVNRVKNELLNRYANGLLTADLSNNVTGSNLPPTTFVLQPEQQKTVSGTLTVNAAAASGVISLTQVAEASIQDRREQSNYAETWLKLDDAAGTTTYADFSGNLPARTATCTVAQCPGTTLGVSGQAASFDGVNDKLTIDLPQTINGSFTVAAWVKPNTTSGSLAIMGSRAPGDNSFDVKLQNGSQLHADIGDGSKWLTITADTPLAYSIGSWYHIAYVVTPQNYTIYVNGVQKASGTYNSGTPLLTDANHRLLVGNYGNGEPMNGVIDDVRVFARALRSDEVAALTILPVLKLNFDSGRTQFADASGQGNNATCSGSQCPTLKGGILGAAPSFRDAADARTDDDLYHVNSNSTLNLNDGNMTLMAWVYPKNTSDNTYNMYPQGLLGYNSGSANAMPALERVGRKLRLGFGTASGWFSATTSSDVLTLDTWQQVAATFDGTTARFYVNGVEMDNSLALSGKQPNASDYQLLIGRSDENWIVDFYHLFGYSKDPTDNDEFTVAWYDSNGVSYCPNITIYNGTHRDMCDQVQNRAAQPGNYFRAWEEDGESSDRYNGGDDLLAAKTFAGTDPNGDYIANKCTSAVCADLSYRILGLGSVPLAGRLDEVAIYKRPLSGAELTALYDATRNGQLWRLDEPPGSAEFTDAIGATKFTCTGSACPTAGVPGRIAQGLQFAANQSLSGPWSGGNVENAVSLWFKTSQLNSGLFSFGSAANTDRQVWLDASGNLNARLDGGESSLLSLTNASQSSTLASEPGGGVASRAIDGNLDTYNSTQVNQGASWQADIAGGAHRVTSVRVYNRFDACCRTRLNTFKVILSDANGNQVWSSLSQSAGANANPIVVAVPNVTASRVKIQLDGSNYLHLAEVEVETDPIVLTAAQQNSTLTSEPGGGAASRAIDDNLYTYHSTQSAFNASWQAEISGTSRLVTAIRVYNRRDCCQERLSPFNVYLYDAADNEIWRKEFISHDQGNNPLIIPVPNLLAKKLKIELAKEDYLHMAEVRLETRLSLAETIRTSGTNYADGQWHNLVYTFGGTQGGQKIYVDGTLKISGNANQSINLATTLYLGTAQTYWLTNGNLDQVRLFSRSLSASKVSELFADVPAALFKFDEGVRATTFTNASGTANGTCSGNTCPTSGVKGKVGSAVNFDGLDDDVLVSNSASAVNPTGPYAISAWFNASKWSGVNHLALKGNAYDVYVENGQLKFRAIGVSPDIITTTAPAANQWQQVVANYTGSALQIWVNGSLANSVPASGTPTTSNVDLHIGAAFAGQLDDVALYKRSLNGAEIRAQYLYQLGLVAERQSFKVTIDNDNPISVTVRSNPVFMPNRDRVMDLQAFDPTSSIAMVQLGTQKNGATSQTWYGAQPCRDAADTSSWCITFAPNGEGRYTLQPRAIDVVGHQTTGSAINIDVDATAPTITLNNLPTIVKPTKVANLGWTVALSGTISDPTLVGGFAGSGGNAVLVTLFNPDGSVLGSGAQRATVTGNTWTIDYAVPDAEPLGVFAIKAQAADRMGNTANFSLGNVRLDPIGPVAGLAVAPREIITGAMQLNGTVVEEDVPTDAALYLPFEEVVSSTVFMDRARNLAFGHTAVQSSTITSEPGSPDRAVDGDLNTINHTTLEAKPWWQVDLGSAISLTQIVLWNRTDCCSDRLSNFRVFVSTNPFTSTDPAQTQVQPGVWTYSNAGAAGATLPISTLQNNVPITGRYVRVQLLGTNYLHLREVQVFSPQRPIGTCSGTACPTVGGAGYVGQAAQFDGNDDAVSLPVNLLSANSFSFAGWVKLSGTSNGQRVFDLGNSSTEYLYLSPRSSNGRVRFEIKSASGSAQYLESPASLPTNTWTPVAVTLDGANDLARIYLNGAEIVSGTISVDPNQIAQTSNWLGKSRLGADPYFNGALDEAAFYNRVLTTDEIQRLAQTTVAGVQGVEAAFTQVASGLSVESTSAGLYLPLDDAPDQNNAIAFKNLASTANATCSGTTCPTPGAVGMRGAAAQFDGNDDYLRVTPPVDLANGSFSVAYWAKRSLSGDTVPRWVFSIGDGGAGNYKMLMVGFDSTDHFRCSLGESTFSSPAAYTDTRWHHFGCTYEASTKLRTLYVDGVSVAHNTLTQNFQGSGDWLIGAWLSSPDHVSFQFAGAVDDVRVVPYAWSDGQVQDLYRGLDPALRLDFENNFADGSAWVQAVSAPTPAQTPRLLPGAGIAGQMSAQFDGVDDQLTLTPTVALADKSFSVMFWAKQTRFGVYQFALGAGSVANNQGLQIGFTNLNQFVCSFYANDLVTSATYTDSNWHHWTCTFDARTKQRTIYRDGTRVAQDTASANYQGGNNWTIGNSAWGNAPFQGQLDDMRVYPVALPADEVNALAQTGFRSANVASAGAGVTASTWTLTPPAGLEGVYRLDVRGKDANGQVDLTTLGNNQWTGIVDTTAPRILYSVKSNQFGAWTYHIFTVRDFNLDADSIRMSVICNVTNSTRPEFVGAPAWPAPKYANPAWYRLGGGQPKLFEQTLVCVQAGLDQPGATLTVCDTAGNCTQQNSANPPPSVAADVDAASAMIQHLTASDRSTPANAAGGPGANITIQTPAANTVLSTTDPISITGVAESFLSLKAVTVTVDGAPVYTASYLAHAITMTNFAVDWTPVIEGAHVLQAEAADWGPDSLYTTYLPIMLQTGSIGLTEAAETRSALPVKPQVFSTSQPIMIYLDLTPPIIDLGSTVFTRTAYAPPIVRFSGSVTDALGLDTVIVDVGDSELVANTEQADQWTADWPVDASALPDGVTYPITATAIDRAGHLTTDVITGVIDVVGPNVQPSSTIDDQPLVAGLWITQTAPHTYTLTLPPAVDGSGVAGYWFGYTVGPTFTLDMLEFVPYDANALELTRPIVLPSDGQALYLHVVAYDALGNDTTQTFGPVYVDTPVTPDYISMNEASGPYQGLPYRQWMDNSCSYLGQDQRIPLRAQSGAALAEAQKLYATWDRDALRVTWSGADWNRDGDLFVYFDSISDELPDWSGTYPYVRHGGNVAYNPYTSTNPSTLMFLPNKEWWNPDGSFIALPPGSPTIDRMNADFGIWLENNTTVHWLHWDNAQNNWVEDPAPAGLQFNFADNVETPLTELSVPFSALDTLSRDSDSISLVAFASENDGLRIWSALPADNPATSARVVRNAVAYADPFQIMLTNRYTLNLGDNRCRAPAYRLMLNIVSEPGGFSYNSAEDETRLIVPPDSVSTDAYAAVYDDYDAEYQAWLSGYCQEHRYDAACDSTQKVRNYYDTDNIRPAMKSIKDVVFPPLLAGDRVTYTLQYINEGPLTQTIPLWMWGVPAGASGSLYAIQWDPQPWTYGCENWLNVEIPPSSRGEKTFTGLVTSPVGVTTFQFDPNWTLHPDCTFDFNAQFDVPFKSDVFYDIDIDAPRYLSIDTPRTVIGDVNALLHGTVIDASPVPTLFLMSANEDGSMQASWCDNPTPTALTWDCVLNLGAQADGSHVRVRAQATDLLGNVSAVSPWLTMTVDTQAPTVALDAGTQDALADGIVGPSEAILSGTASDNHLLSSISVCDAANACTEVDPTLDPATVPQSTYVYDDVPETPIAIAANSGQSPTAPGGLNVPNVCGAGTVGLWRTFSVPDDFVISNAEIGLNVTHPNRSDLRVKLWKFDPATASTVGPMNLISFTLAFPARDLDVLLTDATLQTFNYNLLTRDWDRAPQDVNQPYYDNERFPTDALSALNGQSAQGVWTLVICDTKPAVDEGTYNRAQLILKADTPPENTQGSWQYTLPFTDNVDGAPQTLKVYGTDSVGNRTVTPQIVTFMADNVAPTLAVTQTAATLGLFTPVQPIAFTGIVSDGAGVQSVMVTTYSPSGQVKIEAAPFTDGGANLDTPGAISTWEYALTPLEVGKYTVTIVATDRAGNSISSSAYEVNVLDLSLGSHRTYLPLMAKNTAIINMQVDGQSTEIAAPIVSVITNLFQWLTPSP